MKQLLIRFAMMLPCCAVASTWVTEYSSGNEISWCYEELNSSQISLEKVSATVWPDTLKIPSTLSNKQVVNIGNKLFTDKTGIKAVEIPVGVTNIGVGAFYNCSGLKSVVLNSGIRTIQSNAFAYCGSLTTMNLPGTVESIGDSAFARCGFTSLVWASQKNNRIRFGKSVFSGCPSLNHDAVQTFLNRLAWYGQDIPAYMFSGCTNIITSSLIIRSEGDGFGIQHIGDSAFSGCSSLQGVILYEGLQSIGENAFAHCSMGWINSDNKLPASVKTIGDYAFAYNTRMQNTITISKGVTSLGLHTFYGCENLQDIAVDDANTCYASVRGVVYDKAKKTVLIVPQGKKAVVVASGTKTIGESAFSYCKKLTSVILPEGLTSIGASAFSGCTALESIDIPSTVTSIGDSAFSSCEALTTVSIPEGVTSIGNNAFIRCSRLLSISIPSSVTTIGNHAFRVCDTLGQIRIEEGDETRLRALIESTDTSKNWTAVDFVTEMSDTAKGAVTFIATNVVIHYIVNSTIPEKVLPATYDTGFVNIITEVKSGGAVSVPATWMANYQNYVAKFGNDFTKSLMKPTGKKDGANNPMLVWQDYVAGTDPTDENDVFTASITTDANGKIIISYNPELSDDEKAKRIYTTFGKVKLTDADWVEVPTGHEADYNFFKVTVEMK